MSSTANNNDSEDRGKKKFSFFGDDRFPAVTIGAVSALIISACALNAQPNAIANKVPEGIIKDKTVVVDELKSKMTEYPSITFVPEADSFSHTNDTANVSLINPVQEYDDIDTLTKNLGFTVKMPGFLPDGFKITGISSIGNEVASIEYTDSDGNPINYRYGKIKGDLSGVYLDFDEFLQRNETTFKTIVKFINSKAVVGVKMGEDESFSVYAERGISRADMLKIISGGVN